MSGESRETTEKPHWSRSLSSPMNKTEKPATGSAAASEKRISTAIEAGTERASHGAGKADVSSRLPKPGETDLSHQQTPSPPSGYSLPKSAPAAQPDEATPGRADIIRPGPLPNAKVEGKKRPGTEHTLPPDVYRRLRKPKVSALAYSETPERRFVIINSQKMVEKESTEQGLVVEEIVDDGIIFSFEGHRFFKRMIP